MKLRFNIDDKPSLGATLLYGLQWLMICLPVVLTSTFIAPEGEVVAFTQKLFALCGITIIIQVLWGHRLPLVAGPAAVLLMGVLAAASQGHAPSVIYPSMMIGGALVTLLAVCGAPHRSLYRRAHILHDGKTYRRNGILGQGAPYALACNRHHRCCSHGVGKQGIQGYLEVVGRHHSDDIWLDILLLRYGLSEGVC